MWYASAVSHHTISSANPNPLASATSTTSASGVPSASTRLCSGHTSTSTSPTNSGRRGRQRIPISEPITAPRPATPSSQPNTPVLPYTSRATTGPSEYHHAYTQNTDPVNTAIVTHTHGLERTSLKPARSSSRTGAPPTASWRARGWMGISSAALSTNVAASNANASPAPTPSTSAVASAGPSRKARVA